MKQCPICHARTFDDAVTCYGCLHEFTEADNAAATGPEGHSAPAIVLDGAPPAFVIQIRPERERSGLTSWTCTVDLLPA